MSSMATVILAFRPDMATSLSLGVGELFWPINGGHLVDNTTIFIRAKNDSLKAQQGPL